MTIATKMPRIWCYCIYTAGTDNGIISELWIVGAYITNTPISEILDKGEVVIAVEKNMLDILLFQLAM